jgi:hypothetical protein
LPDALAVGGAGGAEGQIGREGFTVKIIFEGLFGAVQEGGRLLVAAPAPFKGNDPAAVFGDGQVA